MKHTFKIKLILFLLIAFMLISPICMASDKARTSSENAVVNNISSNNTESTYEFVSSDVYEFNQDIVIDSIVDGNVFAFGDNITITGEIGGDVFAFGNNITIAENGYVHGSIFAFAQEFNMNGLCYDIYGGAQNFKLGEKAIVARDIRIASNRIQIDGQVKRNAFLSTTELVFPENASKLISGNLEYTATSEFTIDKNVVGGEIKFTQEVSEESTTQEKITSFVFGAISTLLYSLAIILLTIWLAPNFKNKVGNIIQKKLPLSLGIGLGTLFAFFVIIVLTFILLIVPYSLGVNITIALITIIILALSISQTVFAMGCAKLVAKKTNKDNLPMFIGMSLLVVFVLRLVTLIPVIGGFIGFFSIMIGLGMIIFNLINRKELVDENNSEVK